MKLDLKSLYKQKIVPSLIEEFGYKNIEQLPKLVKISVNRGVGEASKNSKELDACVKEMSMIQCSTNVFMKIDHEHMI